MGLPLAACAGGFLLLPLLSRLPPSPWLLVAAGVFLLAWSYWRQRWLLAVGLFLLSFAWSVVTAGRALALRIPAAWEEQGITADGYVVDLPEAAAPQGVHLRFRPQRLAVGDRQVNIPASGNWQLFAPFAELPPPGSRCRLVVRLKRPHGAANPGGFDYEAWLLAEGIGATGTVRALSCHADPPWSVDRLRWQLRMEFQRKFPERPAAGVLLALITGDRALVLPAAWERYTATGIVHLMAISGLHITLLAAVGAWLVLCLLRRWPRLALHCPLHKPALAAGFLVALAYSLLAGFSVPTARTLVMLGVVLLTACLESRLPVFQVLLLALVAVLAWSPLAVHAAGFWLSFGAVALLLLLGDSYRHLPAWRQALQLQLAMSLLLLPLTLWFFDRVSWISPFANLLAVPLVTFLVVPLGLLGLGCWLLGLSAAADWLWQAATLLVEVLDALMEQFASWPYASLDLGLTGPLALLWLGLALACLMQPLRPGLRLLAPLLLLPLLVPPSALQPGQLRATVIDVGQGLAVLVETPGHRLLYDTGPVLGPYADAGRRNVLPVLHHQGIYALDRLVLSHDDKDHTGGAGSVLESLPVSQGLGARPQALTLATTPPWQACRAGMRWRWEGWDFTVLYPDPEQFRYAKNDNNRSCVLRISRGRAALLLPGDLERLGELSLLGREPELHATVLVLGHHGSNGASSAEWLAAVRPQLALVSAGYRNAFRHPGRQLLERLRSAGIPWRNTADSGAVTLLLNENGLVSLEEFRHRSPHYWQDDDAHTNYANRGASAALGGVGVNR